MRRKEKRRLSKKVALRASSRDTLFPRAFTLPPLIFPFLFLFSRAAFCSHLPHFFPLVLPLLVLFTRRFLRASCLSRFHCLSYQRARVHARDHSLALSIARSDFFHLFFTILPATLFPSFSLPFPAPSHPQRVLPSSLRVYDDVACSASLLWKRLDCLLVRYTYHRADIVCEIILFRCTRRLVLCSFFHAYARARARESRSCSFYQRGNFIFIILLVELYTRNS